MLAAYTVSAMPLSSTTTTTRFSSVSLCSKLITQDSNESAASYPDTPSVLFGDQARIISSPMRSQEHRFGRASRMKTTLFLSQPCTPIELKLFTSTIDSRYRRQRWSYLPISHPARSFSSVWHRLSIDEDLSLVLLDGQRIVKTKAAPRQTMISQDFPVSPMSEVAAFRRTWSYLTWLWLTVSPDTFS